MKAVEMSQSTQREQTIKSSERPNHPLAGQIMTGAEMVLQVLSDEGVDTIFGYSGGAILPTYDAVFRFNETHASEPDRQIRLIVPANEQGAGFMAAGYARAEWEGWRVPGNLRAWGDQHRDTCARLYVRFCSDCVDLWASPLRGDWK